LVATGHVHFLSFPFQSPFPYHFLGSQWMISPLLLFPFFCCFFASRPPHSSSFQTATATRLFFFSFPHGRGDPFFLAPRRFFPFPPFSSDSLAVFSRRPPPLLPPSRRNPSLSCGPWFFFPFFLPAVSILARWAFSLLDVEKGGVFFFPCNPRLAIFQ